MDYALNIDQIVKAAGGKRVGSDRWQFRDSPVVIASINRVEVVLFEGDSNKPSKRQLVVDFETPDGHDLTVICPGYLRTGLLKSVAGPLGEYLHLADGESVYDVFRQADEVPMMVTSAFAEAMGGRNFLFQYEGEGEARSGETAPHVFKVYTLDLDVDLHALQASIDALASSPPAVDRSDL